VIQPIAGPKPAFRDGSWKNYKEPGVIGKIDWNGWDARTIFTHAGFGGTGKSRSSPIQCSVAYSTETADELASYFNNPIVAGRMGKIYWRLGNAQSFEIEMALAGAYGAGDALVFTTGMAGIYSTIRTLVAPGKNFVGDKTLYGCTHNLFTGDIVGFPTDNIEVRIVDMQNPKAVEAAIDEDTCLIYTESIANPNLRLIDLSALAKIADGKIPIVVDATFAGPLGGNLFEYGANIVIHSLTKIITGSGQAMGGAVIGAGPFIDNLFHARKDFGGALHPNSGDIILMGMQSLPDRYDRMLDNANQLAKLFLERSDAVDKVYYSGFDPLYLNKLCNGQMSGGAGTMIAVVFKNGVTGAKAFIDNTALFGNLVSLGTVDTRGCLSGETTQRFVDDQAGAGIPEGLYRISVGCEARRDIIADAERGLEAVKKIV